MKYAIGQVLTMAHSSEVGYVTGDLAISPESSNAPEMLLKELRDGMEVLKEQAKKRPCSVKGFCCFIRFPDADADAEDDYFDADEFKWLVTNALEDIKI